MRESLRTSAVIGKVFNQLTVINHAGATADSRHRWQCRCTCGNIATLQASDVKSGHSKSCGCGKLRSVTTHGHASRGTQTPEYRSWSNMIGRCGNQNSTGYKNYGARGITVCERWLHSFENFLADMGTCPKGMTLERKNNNKGYSRGNCKWATHAEQLRNTRRTRKITFNGKTQCMLDWARERQIHKSALRARLARGWPIEKALNLNTT